MHQIMSFSTALRHTIKFTTIANHQVWVMRRECGCPEQLWVALLVWSTGQGAPADLQTAITPWETKMGTGTATGTDENKKKTKKKKKKESLIIDGGRGLWNDDRMRVKTIMTAQSRSGRTLSVVVTQLLTSRYTSILPHHMLWNTDWGMFPTPQWVGQWTPHRIVDPSSGM